MRKAKLPLTELSRSPWEARGESIISDSLNIPEKTFRDQRSPQYDADPSLQLESHISSKSLRSSQASPRSPQDTHRTNMTKVEKGFKHEEANKTGRFESLNDQLPIPEDMTAIPKAIPYLEAARKRILQERLQGNGQREMRNSWGKRLPHDYQSRIANKLKFEGLLGSGRQELSTTSLIMKPASLSTIDLRSSLEGRNLKGKNPDSPLPMDMVAEMVNRPLAAKGVNKLSKVKEVNKLTKDGRPKTSLEEIVLPASESMSSGRQKTSTFSSNAMYAREFPAAKITFTKSHKESIVLDATFSSGNFKSDTVISSPSVYVRPNLQSIGNVIMVTSTAPNIPNEVHPVALRPHPRPWPHEPHLNPLGSNPYQPPAREHVLPSLSISLSAALPSRSPPKPLFSEKARDSPHNSAPLLTPPPVSASSSPSSFYTSLSYGTLTPSINSHSSTHPKKLPTRPSSPRTRAILSELSSSSSSNSSTPSPRVDYPVPTSTTHYSLLNQGISPAPQVLDISWLKDPDSMIIGINDAAPSFMRSSDINMSELDFKLEGLMQFKANKARRRRDISDDRRSHPPNDDNSRRTREPIVRTECTVNTKSPFRDGVTVGRKKTYTGETIYDPEVIELAKRCSPEIMRSEESSPSLPNKNQNLKLRKFPLMPPVSKFHSPKNPSLISTSSSRGSFIGAITPPIMENSKDGNLISHDIGFCEGEVEGYAKGFREGFKAGVAVIVRGQIISGKDVKLISVRKGKKEVKESQ
jgi:hypothetical protein